MQVEYIFHSIVLSVLLSLFVAFVIANIFKNKFLDELSPRGDNDSIDGLRGLSALAVAIHHSFFFYGYATYGTWSLDYIGHNYIHVIIDYLGRISVSVFFMITAFLFWGKILENGKDLNWIEFYIKRFFRIIPLYIIVVLLAFCYVLLNARGSIEFYPYLRDAFFWFTFDFFGTPNINGFPLSKTLVAGVFWTLSYEWSFYTVLPLLSVFTRRLKTSLIFLVLSFILLSFLNYNNVAIGPWQRSHILCFIIGASCAHFKRVNWFSSFCLNTDVFSLLSLFSLFLCSLYFSEAYSFFPTLILGFLFLLVCHNNSFFGVLTAIPLKLLGAISFSVYLIHGLCYTILFKFLLVHGFGYMQSLLITITIIISLSCFTYLYIERVGIRIGKKSW
ncbi:acyltransferase family protein [Mangrovibacter yixingensis]|uniref:acyltransferase family protein n=1 Tax=Mangrovibacter yixingensis TaxID=1529639 RepID=UPI001CFB6042|nr:acyltransferase [Mangrovibacter yixingensis]